MKIKLLFLLAIVFGLSSPSSACSNFNYHASSDTPGLLCNESSTITVDVRELAAKDYVRLRLFQENSSGGWDFVAALTSGTADQYSGGTCYDIDETFTVNPTYNETNNYRVEITTYIYGKNKLYTEGGIYYTNEVEPAGYYATEVQSLSVNDSEGNPVSWASGCIAPEFSLDLTALQGPTYTAEYTFVIRASDVNSTPGAVLSQSVGVYGEDLGDFAVPFGPSLESWMSSTVQPMFESVLASYTSGYVLIEISVENADCNEFSDVSKLLEVRQRPYVSSFNFEWNDDNNGSTPLGSYPGSQNNTIYPIVGGVSTLIVADVSTAFYDKARVKLFKSPFGGFEDLIGDDETTGIVNGLYSLNINSIDFVAGKSISDMPISNPDERYRVEFTVSTDGCLSDTYWSYFEVGTPYQFQKMSNSNLSVNNPYHYVDQKNAKLYLIGESLNNDGIDSYEVYSLDGRRKILTANSTIDLNNLSKGMYLVLVKSGKEVKYREKFLW